MIDKNTTVASPITGGKTILIETIDCNLIIKKYKKKLNIDTARFFTDTPEISIYECLDTKYRFFHPFNISGDGVFYEELQDTNGYYLPWKWEHQTALELMNKDNVVLEIGSARGAFLEGLKKHFGNEFNAQGIELNIDAAKTAQAKGLDVRVESIESVSEKMAEKYDVVCFFQVLEHINDVMPFINNAVKCLKPKGKLIVSVPNNDSFIKHLPLNILNLPPHHMGLWDKTSLTNMAKIAGLSPIAFHYEALSKIHVWSYYHSKVIKTFGDNLFSKAVFATMIPFILYKKNKGFNTEIEGHSVLAIFEKQ